jgi:hypothetical protein
MHHWVVVLPECVTRDKITVPAQEDGRVAERFKAPVLKTGLVKANVGSNPSPSAKSYSRKTEYGEVPEWPNGIAC